MKRLLITLLCAVFVEPCFAMSPALADVPDAPAMSSSSLQLLLDQRVSENPGTGIVAVLIDNGKVTVAKAGTSGAGRALDEHTLFEIGSLTKTFTATVLESMVQDGQVALDDPAKQFLPSSVHVPSKDGKQITLLDLATHRSGLPRLPSNLDAYAVNPYATYGKPDLYAFLSTYALTRDPGTLYEYSNVGVGLLGVLLANRAEEPFETLVRSRVLKPLGMDETAMALTPELQSRLAIGHDIMGNASHSWEFDALAGAGAIRSTAADMEKFLRCEMGEGPLAKLCLATQQPQTSMPGGKIGLVWQIDDGTGVIEHNGETAGFHSMLAVSADHRKGVVLLANGVAPVEELAYNAIGVHNELAHYEHVALEPSVLGTYSGKYAMQGMVGTITFAVDGNSLTAQMTGQDSARLFPLGDDRFYYRVVAASYRFLRDASGQIVGVALFQDGRITMCSRLGADGKPVGTLPDSPFPTVVPLAADALKAYVGVYDMGYSKTMTIAPYGDGLSAQLTGQLALPVFPMGNDRFFLKVVDAQLQFSRDARGHVIGGALHQNGIVIPMTLKH